MNLHYADDIILEDSDVDYLLFFHREPNNWCYFHLVEAYRGSPEFYEFGDELYSVKIWCSAPEFAHNLLYHIGANIGAHGFDYLETLYTSVGGFLKGEDSWTPYSELPN